MAKVFKIGRLACVAGLGLWASALPQMSNPLLMIVSRGRCSDVQVRPRLGRTRSTCLLVMSWPTAL
eukprot:470376-Pyramimonas_sp.AAC.1